MSATGPALPIHSLTEARLYVKVSSCSACAAGPLVIDLEAVRHAAGTVTLPVSCRQCNHSCEITFDTTDLDRRGPIRTMLNELHDPAHLPAAQVINPTRQASQIIDVPGWLTLYTIIAEAARVAGVDAETMAERAKARRLHVEAGQCLAEALKFYEEDNDLPPAGAFFSEESRKRLRARPELFTRQRLLSLRNELPHLRGQ